LSAFAALCLFALTFALMLGIRLAFSAVLAALRDVSMADGQRLLSANLSALTVSSCWPWAPWSCWASG
jgi:hypothetical protein